MYIIYIYIIDLYNRFKIDYMAWFLWFILKVYFGSGEILYLMVIQAGALCKSKLNMTLAYLAIIFEEHLTMTTLSGGVVTMSC